MFIPDFIKNNLPTSAVAVASGHLNVTVWCRGENRTSGGLSSLGGAHRRVVSFAVWL